MFHIFLDTVEPDDPGLGSFCDHRRITMDSNGEGPNGWEVIEYTGTREALEDLCRNIFDDESLIEDIERKPWPTSTQL